MTVLMRACGSNVLHSRIADLRREGVGKIENRMTFIYDGDARIVISEYRFTPQQDCDKRHNLGGKSK